MTVRCKGSFGVDRSDRDPQHARAAFSDFSKLVRGYPNSQYTTDATKRLVFLKDRLAKYEYPWPITIQNVAHGLPSLTA